MSFEKIYHNGKEVKRDTDIIVADIDPNIVFVLNPKTMYKLKSKKLKKVVDKK